MLHNRPKNVPAAEQRRKRKKKDSGERREGADELSSSMDPTPAPSATSDPAVAVWTCDLLWFSCNPTPIQYSANGSVKPMNSGLAGAIDS